MDKSPNRDKRVQHTVVELEVVGGLGGPQPHGVDSVVLVARHRRVIWHGQHHLAKGETVRIKSARDMVPSPGFTSLTGQHQPHRKQCSASLPGGHLLTLFWLFSFSLKHTQPALHQDIVSILSLPQCVSVPAAPAHRCPKLGPPVKVCQASH